MKNVLAFFGAFNPPTVAHLKLAEFACRRTGREGVLFVPSQTAYIRDSQKKDAAFSDEERLNMLKALAGHYPWMAVTDWELRQAGQPRTYTTLCHLREEGYAPSLLLGSDKLPELATGWKHVPEIASEFGIVCLARGTDSCRKIIESDPFLRGIAGRIEMLETPPDWKDISSTEVRNRLRELRAIMEDLARMVPAEILNFVKKSNADGGQTD